MYAKSLLSVMSLLIGLVAGFWLNAERSEPVNGSVSALAEQNNQLLHKLDETLIRFDALPQASITDNCADLTALLPELKQTLRDSVQAVAAHTFANQHNAGSRALPDSLPTDEQQELYQSVERRIYSYADSGEPLLEAMAGDEDFQRLSESQKKQLATEVAQRYNRGEITLSQLRGNQ